MFMVRRQHGRAQRRTIGIRVVLFSLFLGVSTVSRAISEADKYFDRIRIINEVLAQVQLKYVDENKVQTEALIQGAIEGMLKSLDPHSAYMVTKDYDEFQEDTRGTFGGLGITIDIRDGWLTVMSPLPDTPAFRAGILAGDKIIKIEGESTEGLDVKEAVRRLRGEPGSKVTITIFRPSDRTTVDHTIVRDIIHVPNVYAYLIEDHIGYIRLVEFKQTASSDLNQALEVLKEKKIDGLILDLRFNSGGLLDMAVEVADKFLPKGKLIVSIRGRDEQSKQSFVSRRGPQTKVPLVVLVNQASASASEIVAGAVQDWGRGVIVGPANHRTYGKGSVQTVIPLSDGSALKLTTARYYTPAGRSIEADHGIEPDIKVDTDDKFLEQLMRLGRLGKLPEDMAKVEQLLPVPTEGTEPLLEAADLESATPENKLEPEALPTPGIPGVPKSNSKKPLEHPEIYDKELAKGVEILKAQKVWAAADNLFR